MPQSSRFLFRLAALTLLAVWLASPLAGAQEAAQGRRPARQQAEAPAAAATPAAVPALPADAVTHHELTLGRGVIAYTATAGTLPLTDEHGATTAQIFYVSFTIDGGDANRPVTYIFNGGPGASSAYLDIGAIGPRVLDFGPSGTLPPADSHVTENPDTWLPFTDLVFIDPVGTGYSRATGGDDAAQKLFWGVSQDIDTLAQIIRLSALRTGRLSAPTYLVGESYGGFRAARLAYELAGKTGIIPAGVMMISPVIDFQLMANDPEDVLPWALLLPSYTAVNLAKSGPVQPESLVEAEHFALHDYLATLAGGADDPGAPQAYATLARLTGLDAGTLAEWQGRIPLGRYIKESPRGRGEILSRYDGTVGNPDPDPWNSFVRDDPVLDASFAPFTRGFVSYAQDELEFKTTLPFEILNSDVNRHWSWGNGGRGLGRPPGASDSLRRGMALFPALRVEIAHGLTDLETPYMMSRYIADHMPQALRDRVELKLYEGGHMMYLRSGSRHRLHDDALAFYTAPPPQ